METNIRRHNTQCEKFVLIHMSPSFYSIEIQKKLKIVNMVDCIF